MEEKKANKIVNLIGLISFIIYVVLINIYPN
jgi:hypothetical protein